MHCNKEGISLDRKELRALLEVASKESDDRDKFGILFRVTGEKVYASATNGRVALEAFGIGDGAHSDGEWFVSREALVEGKKLLAGKQVLRLEFKGASLNHVRVEENGLELSSLSWPKDVAVAQCSFPAVKKDLKIPRRKREIGHCHSVAAAYLAVVELVADAAGVEFADCYPPENSDQPYVFQCGADEETTWTGSILPLKTSASESVETDEA